MKILAAVLALVLASGCTVVRRPADDPDGKPARVVVVVCLLASCRDTVALPRPGEKCSP